jgi:hypothetical protein
VNAWDCMSNKMKLPRRRFLQLAATAAVTCLAGSAAVAARPRSYLSVSEAARLRDEIAAIPGDIRRAFERRYQAWRKTWDSPALAVLSDARSRRSSEEFAALVGLGPQILPLLMDKIAQPQEFFALQAYEVLQPDWPANIEAGGQRVFESEQAKAERAVKDWLRLKRGNAAP